MKRERRDLVKQREVPSDFSEGQENQQVCKVLSNAVTQNSSATSSIVQVFLSSMKEPQKEILTYALLDTQRDSCFVLEDLVRELDVVSQPLQLKLSTMAAVDTVIASKSVCRLLVRRFHSETHIQFRHHTHVTLFLLKSLVYQPEPLHCSGLTLNILQITNLFKTAVGLLIGYDCPSALAPLEVILGGENEPFAQKAELGGSIIGSANTHLDRQGCQRFIHRVAVREIPVPSAADILKILESDFNEG